MPHTTGSGRKPAAPQGRALSIGLNSVNDERYPGGYPPLPLCEADARDMAELAKTRGFHTKTLLTKGATRRAVTNQIAEAAGALRAGDIFLLFFSGHGGQLPDTDGDEPDGRDETWCLYDGHLVDDELYGLWPEFKRGVRILVLSDSCHSGTVVRDIDEEHPRSPRKPAQSPRRTVKASVLLISASLDAEDASAGQLGDANSPFTAQLKQVWNDGRFRGGYRTFWKSIRSRLPAGQTSNCMILGSKNATFLRQKPFTI